MRETPAAAGGFARYLAMGEERSLRALRTEWGQDENSKPPSFSTLARWSSAFEWDRRAREHDRRTAEDVEAKIRAARVADQVKRRQRRLDLTAIASDIIAELMVDPKTKQRRRLAEPGVLDLEPEQVGAGIRLWKLAMEAERLDLGEATDRTEHSGPEGGPIQTQEVRVLSPEDLKCLERFFHAEPED